jgi:hypothetical protein
MGKGHGSSFVGLIFWTSLGLLPHAGGALWQEALGGMVGVRFNSLRCQPMDKSRLAIDNSFYTRIIVGRLRL